MRGDVGIAPYEQCFYSFLTRSPNICCANIRAPPGLRPPPSYMQGEKSEVFLTVCVGFADFFKSFSQENSTIFNSCVSAKNRNLIFQEKTTND